MALGALSDPRLLALLLALAAFAILILVFKYVLLQSRFNDRLREQVQAWREMELGTLRAEMDKGAKAQAYADFRRWMVDAEAEIREDAVRRSQAVIAGKVTEHLAPYLGQFPYNPKDVRFLGTPIDLVIFDGMNDDALREIVFLEIKTAGASLSTRERRIRDAVEAGRVVWREFRLGPA
jgi:predicted Holliday junction resolvase-like endonuclease